MAAAAVPIALAVLSTAAGAMGAIQQSQQQKATAQAQSQQAEWNAQQARNNAIVQQQNADLAKQQAAAHAKVLKAQGEKSLAKQTVNVMASGLTMSGSAWDVWEESNVNLEQDVLNTLYEGDLKARNFNIGASNLQSEAGLLSTQAQNYAATAKSTSPALGVAAAVVGGASSAYGAYKSAYPSFQTSNYTPTNVGYSY